MFGFKQMKQLFNFVDDVHSKAFNVWFEVSENKIFIEFEVDDFKRLEKYIKDWLIFYSDIISAYDVEWTDDDICRFNLYLNKGE